ncbi:hypothetical protein JZ751_026162 [Albula glossodonta]|uniref:Uncharacterized protein n=1 Tax=Albula glossodonta TaxID=121402 RepID=A0A8T2PC56_9TELE|nr:hypothetical protein JZ751_026162 [Albula glossodonta]
MTSVFGASPVVISLTRAPPRPSDMTSSRTHSASNWDYQLRHVMSGMCHPHPHKKALQQEH